jgi:hypothetical protein
MHAPARPPGEDIVHVVQQAFHFLSFSYCNVLVCSTENSTRNTRQEYTSIRYLTLTVAPIDDVPPPPPPNHRDVEAGDVLHNAARQLWAHSRQNYASEGVSNIDWANEESRQRAVRCATPFITRIFIILLPLLSLSLFAFICFFCPWPLIHIVCLHVSQRSDVIVNNRT